MADLMKRGDELISSNDVNNHVPAHVVTLEGDAVTEHHWEYQRVEDVMYLSCHWLRVHDGGRP